MKSLLVKLEIKPLSINNKMIPVKRGKYARLIKANSFRVYENQLDAGFRKYFDQFRQMGYYFDPKKHCIQTKWSVYIPEKKFFTVKGTINKKCIDATNTVKILEDRLSFILGIDDSQICESSVRKIPTDSSSWCVVLELSIEMRPEVVRLGNEI